MGELLAVEAGGAGWRLAAGLAIGAMGGRGLRPARKAVVRAGLTVGDRLGAWRAEMREQGDDVVAEARADHSAVPATGTAEPPTG